MNRMKYSKDKHGVLHLRPNDHKQQHRQRSDWLRCTLNILSRVSSDGKEQSLGGGLRKSQGRAPVATKGNCVLVCISKNTASRSRDVIIPLGTC